MGATGTRCSAKTREQFFRAELEHGAFAGEVIAHAVRGTTIYVAVRHPDGYVYGAVVETWKDNHEKDYWIYKLITEDMGPRKSKCPLHILRLLSPTNSKYAMEWREECYRQFRRNA